MFAFPKRPLGELVPGPAQITGHVRASGPLLRAPVSDRPCVYYQVLGRNHVRPWHDRPSYPPSDTAFWIDDEAGGQLWVLVPASPSIECTLTGDGFRRTIYAGESPALDRLLDPGGFPFAPDAYVKVEERIVVQGDALTVAGQVLEEISARGRTVNYRSPPVRLILRAQSIRGAADR
jgi:hypothetical protein